MKQAPTFIHQYEISTNNYYNYLILLLITRSVQKRGEGQEEGDNGCSLVSQEGKGAGGGRRLAGASG
jgi:hypothetical protein